MKNLTLAIALLGTLLLTSCGTAFRRQWSSAPTPPSGIEGRWEGTWHSEGTGHRGTLRCIVGPALNQEGDHLFAYRATWGSFLSGTFKANHRVTAGKTDLRFTGKHELASWAGGTYQYDGTVRKGQFEATYRCEKDHGTFSMKRPAAAPLSPR